MLQTCGEKGGAKSMLEVLIKEFVDPAKPKLLSIHKDRMEFIQQVAQNYLVFYDNLKYPPRWLSDEACRAVTGSGSSKRKLYTDDDSVVYEYKRCLGFNGISLVLTEPDALDRSIIIEQERIDKKNRIPEQVILSRFYELRSKLLGYIFDVLVKAMNIKPTIKLDGYPRMADFAEWSEAIARAMGYNENEFIDILDNNTGKQNAEAIENSVLGQVITRFLNGLPDVDINSGFCYESTVSELLVRLNDVATLNHISTNHKGWPKAANSLTRRLKAIASNIREGLGFEISITRYTTGIHKGVSSVKIWKVPSLSSLSSPDQNQAQNGVQNGEDISSSDDTYPRRDPISSPEDEENRAQNATSEDSDGSEDVFLNINGDLPDHQDHLDIDIHTDVQAQVQLPENLKPYHHMIETQYLPNLNRTAFRCKEHPDAYYYDPNGILKSHFEPFHKTGTQDGL
jgi:hypothetical protein